MENEVYREVVYDHVIDYINSFSNPEYLKDMRDYAIENHVPIVEKETESFIKFLFSTTKPKKVLELGTAIGYSAISFTMDSTIESYTTVELREDFTNIARDNIKKYGLDKKIEVLNGDAYEVVQTLQDQYDIIFVDAAKGQYKKYFDKCEKLLKEEGIIICDNILFRGMVTKKELAVRRKRTIIKRLNEFISYIKKDERFVSSIIPIGDGLLLVRRKV
ncbi:O-methyltransferase [Peptoniphilus asaccharolyticus]